MKVPCVDIKSLSGTEFQKLVWQAISEIPRGEVRTYTDIAKQIRRPTAVRAVGTACGKNPLLVTIPCHRVVTSSGKLGQYSGPGGVQAKITLLESEGVDISNYK